jgi:hypothetical protein
MIRKVSFLCFVFIIMIGVTCNSLYADGKTTQRPNVIIDKNNNLTPQEITQRFQIINGKYKIGEVFSAEDAAFVKKYAERSASLGVQSRKSRSFDLSKSNNKISFRMKGTVWTDIGIINHSFGAKFTTTVTKGTPISIKNSVTHTSYGIIGSGGIGKVYSGTLTTTCDGGVKSCTIDEGERYVAALVYWRTDPKATVYYNGGSMSIYNKGDKE